MRLTDRLAAASAIARIEDMIIAIRHRRPISKDDRDWLAEILLPFANETGASALRCFSDLPPIVANAMLKIVARQAEILTEAELEGRMAHLRTVREALADPMLTLDQGEQIAALAKELRSHFVMRSCR